VSTNAVGAYRVDYGTPNYEADWIEGDNSADSGVTWIRYAGGTNWWGTGGGNFAVTPTDEVTLTAGDPAGWFVWDVTSDCDALEMRSWIMKFVTPGGFPPEATAWYSKEWSNSDYHPYLAVTYETASPNPPTDVSASHTADLEITVSWTDQSTNEDYFRIERDKNDGGYVFLANDTDGSPYVDSITQEEFDNKDTFTYRVRAEIADPLSYSDWVYADPLVVYEQILILALAAPFFPWLIRVSSKRANARSRTKGRKVSRKGE